ncbi:cadherin-like protein 26 [Gracilinanus agilis]|uniref:cadherin-like protein 26 n=1 Tax=Gracilinanus agilis TaxID=191870 RepID=UPI001CFCE0B2|nr:cadherin-like protein 26 [Gracilinanus agilis]
MQKPIQRVEPGEYISGEPESIRPVSSFCWCWQELLPDMQPNGEVRLGICSGQPLSALSLHPGSMFLSLLGSRVSLLSEVIVASCHQPAKDELINQTKMKAYHQPLQRFKRRWIITTFEVQEEDPGPFPKLAGELFNNINYNESLIYIISGPGVDEDPIGLFSMEDNHHGKVYVHYPIDREETPFFVVQFDIADRSTLKIVDKSLFFHVKVGDINDNAPQFAEEVFNITVKNNHNPDNPIFQVEAVDLDKGQTPNSEVIYSLVSQMPLLKRSGFHIDRTTGEIGVSGCLHYEDAQLFKLLIRANDQGEPSLSSTATINIAVEDGNNYMPEFIKGDYKMQISEGQMHQGVLRLLVQDHDSPFTPGWKAKYKILHGNEEEHFNIVTDPGTNEGILNVIKPLDYESLTERKLVIIVENEEPFSSCEKDRLNNGSMMTSTAIVSVEITDINDPPQFHPPKFIVQADDGTKPGTQLGRYNVTDPDGNIKNIRFKLVHDPANWVTVDELSGVVTTVRHMDRESPYVNNSFYTIMVSAIDDGIPPQTSTGTIMLFLSDENDNTPTLVKSSIEVCNTEQKLPILVEAEDKDLDPYSGPFTFKLDDTSGNIKDTWKLGKNFGYSVELLRLRNLQNGYYSVSFNILDKQGFFKEQILYVRLCSCLDGITCASSSMTFVGLGGDAIIVICMAFISLAVALLFLLRFSFGSANKRQEMSIPYEQGNQTLIHYNEESENTLTVVKSNTIDPVSQLLVAKGKEMYYPCDKSILYVKNPMENLDRKIAEILTQNSVISILEDNLEYQPHIYLEEGEFEAGQSLSSLSLTESYLPEDFLNDLGSKAIALEEIYSKSVFLK